MTDFTIRPATAKHWPALEALLGRSGGSNGCWCMYWRIGPPYSRRPPEVNKDDLRRLTASGQPPGLLAFDTHVGGVSDGGVSDGGALDGGALDGGAFDGGAPDGGALDGGAFDGGAFDGGAPDGGALDGGAFVGAAAGWCALAPRSELHWLAHARYLQPVDDLPVWSVPCFFVRRTHRRVGVTDALIDAALDVAAAAGAPALEAYPIDTDVPGHTGNLFPGVASTFARHGFQVVARRKPDRPIMRKPLRG
jgi:GNAT superfamily N-acetyltransferase